MTDVRIRVGGLLAVALIISACGGQDGAITKSGESSGGPATTSAAAHQRDAQKCSQVSAALSEIAQKAPTMDAETARQTLDRLATLFPADLQDDFRTIVEQHAAPGSSPDAAAAEATTKAEAAISDYLTSICR